jgi:hypothetical protein
MDNTVSKGSMKQIPSLEEMADLIDFFIPLEPEQQEASKPAASQNVYADASAQTSLSSMNDTKAPEAVGIPRVVSFKSVQSPNKPAQQTNSENLVSLSHQYAIQLKNMDAETATTYAQAFASAMAKGDTPDIAESYADLSVNFKKAI